MVKRQNPKIPACTRVANLKDMRWLVPARNEIQTELLRLYILMGKPSKDIRTADTLNWIAGIGFSLWRAVFQTPSGLKQGANILRAQEFLQEIILNNAAVYKTELNQWSLGYYLGNARLRIFYLANQDNFPRPDRLKALFKAALSPLNKSRPQKGRDAFSEWKACFDCMHELLNQIEKPRRRTT